jgi:hypothetical protein
MLVPLPSSESTGDLPGTLDRLPDEDEPERVELSVQRLLLGQKLLPLLRRHPQAVVAHLHDDPVPIGERGGADDPDLLVGESVDGVHDQVEVHAVEARKVSAQHRGIELAELEVDPRGALLHRVAVDDLGELLVSAATSNSSSIRPPTRSPWKWRIGVPPRIS